jgi:hypothetical protein
VEGDDRPRRVDVDPRGLRLSDEQPVAVVALGLGRRHGQEPADVRVGVRAGGRLRRLRDAARGVEGVAQGLVGETVRRRLVARQEAAVRVVLPRGVAAGAVVARRFLFLFR